VNRIIAGYPVIISRSVWGGGPCGSPPRSFSAGGIAGATFLFTP